MITYTAYNKKSFIVLLPRDHELASEIKNIQGKWNPRAKPAAGWMVPIDNEARLKEILAPSVKMDTFQEHTKSRKKQDKYHRSISDDEKEEKILEICKQYATYIESEVEIVEEEEPEDELKNTVLELKKKLQVLEKSIEDILVRIENTKNKKSSA